MGAGTDGVDVDLEILPSEAMPINTDNDASLPGPAGVVARGGRGGRGGGAGGGGGSRAGGRVGGRDHGMGGRGNADGGRGDPDGVHDVARSSVSSRIKLFYEDPSKLPSSACHRTPPGMNRKVAARNDSGIFVLYAMECDYFDAPIFADPQDWVNIRRKLAYSLLRKQLLY